MPVHEGNMIECRNCTSAAVSALSPPEPPLSLSLTERLKSHRCQPATGSLWRSRSNEYIDGCGMALFQRVCELDLEGIRCQAEVRALRQGARKQHVVQDFESEVFTEGRQRGIVRAGAASGAC